jgi:hypothetical protein
MLKLFLISFFGAALLMSVIFVVILFVYLNYIFNRFFKKWDDKHD